MIKLGISHLELAHSWSLNLFIVSFWNICHRVVLTKLNLSAVVVLNEDWRNWGDWRNRRCIVEIVWNVLSLFDGKVLDDWSLRLSYCSYHVSIWSLSNDLTLFHLSSLEYFNNWSLFLPETVSDFMFLFCWR